MEQEIKVCHVTLEVKADFEIFTKIIEKCLGRFDYSVYQDLDIDPLAVEALLKKSAGEEGLMLFNIQDHGKLLKIFGTPRKAKQYVLGNPLIAITMTRHDIRAALYAPLRMLVYETDNGATQVEYDQPSSLFGQFHNPEVTAVGESLDKKLANLIKKVELAASQQTSTPKSLA